METSKIWGPQGIYSFVDELYELNIEIMHMIDI